MIIGIGHDLSSLDRMDKTLHGSLGDRFRARILTEREQQLASAYNGKRLVEFIAGRFAVKEAVSKAFGCGIGSLLGFRDVEIDREPGGKPICRLSTEAWHRLKLPSEEIKIHVSITHDHAIASAYVIVEHT
ncbi:holo-ACP synthase [Paenibacillus sp. R14(2021)]|uniref:holo-ACP synthase n=1 Tax=Paenibacillus sp. R14(2021) TaxID=2859228 RepID=UPI001C6146D2|nr:holo-ACP synthase [Paenibacillus sp. R14(2021)]